MIPMVFLVLGGILLDVLFPQSFKPTVWIILMGLSLLPVCLIPTLKEGAGAAAAGALGTLLADGIALGLLVANMTPKTLSTFDPPISFSGVAAVFGNLSLAYGAGIVIPALQREHSDPSRMPRCIVVTLGLISVLFAILAVTGFSVVGCQIPGNLLFAIAGDKLGFTASRGGIVLSFLFMQMHITIAFAIILFPAFFIFERLILGLHKDTVESKPYDDLQTPENPSGVRKNEESQLDADMHAIEAEYNDSGYWKVAILRTIIVTLCVVVSIILQDDFIDLQDFVGASSTALCCMILPIVFYLKTFNSTLPWYEKVFAVVVLLITTALAIYVSVHSGKNLFNPSPPNPLIKFPFCAAEHQRVVYTNVTYYNITK